MDRSKVVEWIQKLVAKAMDPACTPEEAESLQEKTAELMAKYKISEMEAVTPKEVENHEMLRENLTFAQGGNMNWGYFLAAGVAAVFECEVVRLGRTQKLSFFGFPDDVETVAFFFRYFQLQIIDFIDNSNLRTVKNKNSYAVGMTRRIVERINEAYVRAKAKMTSECRDLIVVKKDAVSTYVEKEIGKTHKANLSNNFNASAFTKGYIDGAKVDITNPNLDKLAN